MISQENSEWGEYKNVPPMGFAERVISFLVYKLSVYKLFPWEYGGRKIFQFPSMLWIKRHNKGTWMPYNDYKNNR